MAGPDHLQTLTRYKAWANEVIFEALAKLPESELLAKRRIFAGNLLRTLNHTRAMDLVWKAHLEGVPHSLTTRNPESPPFSEVRASQAQLDLWFVEYSRSLTPEKSAEMVKFEFIGGGSGAMSRADMVLHVVNHGTYHRGNVASMMYEIPVQPPSTDLPVFIRETASGRPSRPALPAR